MDYKVFRTAVLAIVSALILVLVIVYATNADKINEIFGKGGASGEGASAATSSNWSSRNWRSCRQKMF